MEDDTETSATSARAPLTDDQETVDVKLGVDNDDPLTAPHYFLPSIAQLVAYAKKFKDKREATTMTFEEIYELSQPEFDDVAFNATRVVISEKDTKSIFAELAKRRTVDWGKMEITGLTRTTTFANVFRLVVAIENSNKAVELLKKSFGDNQAAARAIRHARTRRYISDRHALYLVYRMLRVGVPIDIMHECTPVSKMTAADREKATENLKYMKYEYEAGLMYRTKRNKIDWNLQIMESIALCAVFRNMIKYASSLNAPDGMTSLAKRVLPHAAARWFSVAVRARKLKGPVPAIMPIVAAQYTIAKDDDASDIPTLKHSTVDMYTVGITTPYFAIDQQDRKGFFAVVAERYEGDIVTAVLANKVTSVKDWVDANFKPTFPETDDAPWNDQKVGDTRFGQPHVNPYAMQEDVAEPEPTAPKKKAAAAPKKEAGAAAAARVNSSATPSSTNDTTWMVYIASAMKALNFSFSVNQAEASINGIYGDGKSLAPVILTSEMVDALCKEIGSGWTYSQKEQMFTRGSRKVTRTKILTLFARLWSNSDAVKRIAPLLFASMEGAKHEIAAGRKTGAIAFHAAFASLSEQERNRDEGLPDLRVVVALAVATLATVGIVLNADSYFHIVNGATAISNLSTLRSGVQTAFTSDEAPHPNYVREYMRALIGLAWIHDTLINSEVGNLGKSLGTTQTWRNYLAKRAAEPTTKGGALITIALTTPRIAAPRTADPKPRAPRAAARAAAPESRAVETRAPRAVVPPPGIVIAPLPKPRAPMTLLMFSALSDELAVTTDESTAAFILYSISRAVKDRKMYIGDKIASAEWFDEIACVYAELTTAYWRVVDAMAFEDEENE
jgi:hypothetical protein